MWIASSTSSPGGAGPSATSRGRICCASASDGSTSSAINRNSRRNIVTPLGRIGRLVEVRAEPALGLFQRDFAPRGIILELVAADPSDSEILAVAVREIEARYRRGRE